MADENNHAGTILKFDILGASFTITVEEDENYLNKVLSQYKQAVENTQNISGISNPLNVAVLTGFLLCDEINKMKQSGSSVNNENEADKIFLRVLSNLEEKVKV